MTSNKCLEYNHPTKPQEAYTEGGSRVSFYSMNGIRIIFILQGTCQQDISYLFSFGLCLKLHFDKFYTGI